MKDNTEDTDWLNDYPALKKQQKDNPFLLPQNYFEDQQEQIRTAIFVQTLKQNTSDQAFTVPDQFFDEQQSNIASRIIIDEFAGQKNNFTVPDHFFEIQKSSISSQIIISEFAGEENGFTVPVNYFEDLQKKITQKTGIKEVRPVLASVRKLFIKTTWKYATAACITIAVVTGVVIKQNQPVNVKTQLSNLPDADIENYLKINADAYDNHIIMESSASETLDEINQNPQDSNSNNSFGI